MPETHPSQSHIRATRRWLADLGQHEAFALWFGDRIAEFFRGINPQLDGFIRMRERRFLSVAVGHATGSSAGGKDIGG